MDIVMISIAETAERLGVSTRTVRRFLDAHELEYVKIGRRILIEEAELGRFIECRRSK